MSKATPTDVQALGFVASQFQQSDGSEWTNYLQAILDDVALEVREQVGSGTYAAASATGSDTEKLNEKRIRQAEMYLSGAELMRRRAVVLGADARRGRDAGPGDDQKQALQMSRDFADRADFELASVSGGSRAASFAQSVVETGPYESNQ